MDTIKSMKKQEEDKKGRASILFMGKLFPEAEKWGPFFDISIFESWR